MKGLYLAITASAAGQAQAHSMKAWEAVLAGDIDAALAEEFVLVDAETGRPIDPTVASTPGTHAVVASRRKPNVGGDMGEATREIWRRHEARHDRPANLRRAVPC